MSTHVTNTRTEGADPRRWKALALLCAAFFMAILDSSIVLVALPSIDAELGFSAGDLQWVMSAYLLSFGGLLLLGGRTADLFGRRRVFLAGTGLFALASLGAGLAGSAGMLVAARALQGVAAAVMTPTAMSILMTTFPEGARAQQGTRHLDRDRGDRRHGRLARRRPDHRRPRLGVDLLHQRARRRRRRRAHAAADPREPRGRHRAAAWTSPARSRSPPRSSRSSTRSCEAPEVGWGAPADARRCSPSAGVLIAAFVAVEARSPAPLAPLHVFRSRALVGGNLVLFALGMLAFGVPFVADPVRRRRSWAGRRSASGSRS